MKYLLVVLLFLCQNVIASEEYSCTLYSLEGFTVKETLSFKDKAFSKADDILRKMNACEVSYTVCKESKYNCDTTMNTKLEVYRGLLKDEMFRVEE